MLRMQWPRPTDVPADVVVDQITFRPGESTGWHYHLVPVFAVVLSGTLTRILHDGTVEVSTPGAMFVEAAGRDRVHLGRNLGPDPVVLQIAYALPEGAPLSYDAPAPPACDQGGRIHWRGSRPHGTLGGPGGV
ncbi:cupin domain-containing protein [Streptomyces sp. NPDC002054]|uniref:cupin domain-containing protein n=1 Tax=Streptomyces sp. NPDC002054 TaxID=3154663 RepID=UPI0033241B4B